MTDSARRIVCFGLTPAVQRTLRFGRVSSNQVNRALSVHYGLGGKGANVARVVTQLGGPAVLTGLIGGETGRLFHRLLRAEGVADDWVESTHLTRVCDTLLDDAGQVTELVEDAPPPTAEEWTALAEKTRVLLQTGALLVIAGNLMPGAPADAYAQLLRRVAPGDRPTVLDSSRAPALAALQAGLWLIKMNRHELGDTLGGPAPTDDETPAAARRLLAQGGEWALITAGPDGAWLVGRDRAWRYRPPAIRAVNPIGSGDAVTAGMALALTRGAPLEDAVAEGMACGAANALTAHTAVLDLARLPALRAAVRYARV